MATYIKLIDLAELVRMFYDTYREDIFDQAFWDAFVEKFPTQVVESQQTDTKERDELLMVASRLFAGHLANGTGEYSFTDCIEDAQNLIAARNKACETKEDNK